MEAGEGELLAGVGAGGEQEEVLSGVETGGLEEVGEVGELAGGDLGGGWVVFDGAGVVDAVGWDAELGPALAVFWLWHEDLGKLGEEGAGKPAELGESALGLGGEPGCGEGDWDVAAAGLGDEVGPDLGFEQDEVVGRDLIEQVLNGGWEIDGIVENEDAVRVAHGEGGGDLVAGWGGGGEEESGGGGGLEEGGEAFDGDVHFADADGMDPEAVVEVAEQGELLAVTWAEQAEALPEVLGAATAGAQLAERAG